VRGGRYPRHRVRRAILSRNAGVCHAQYGGRAAAHGRAAAGWSRPPGQRPASKRGSRPVTWTPGLLTELATPARLTAGDREPAGDRRLRSEIQATQEYEQPRQKRRYQVDRQHRSARRQRSALPFSIHGPASAAKSRPTRNRAASTPQPAPSRTRPPPPKTQSP